MTTYFEHAAQLDPDWRPGPGQRYADAPARIMEVTRRAGGQVWYRAAGSHRTGWVADAAQMTEGGAIVGRWLQAYPGTPDEGGDGNGR